MAWNRKGVTYVVTDAPCYEVADGETLVDRYVGAEPMAGSRCYLSPSRRARGLDLRGDQDAPRRLYGPPPLAGGAR